MASKNRKSKAKVLPTFEVPVEIEAVVKVSATTEEKATRLARRITYQQMDNKDIRIRSLFSFLPNDDDRLGY